MSAGPRRPAGPVGPGVADLESLRERLHEQVDEADEVALRLGELLFQAVQDPLDPALPTAFLADLMSVYEAAAHQQSEELDRLRRQLEEQRQELGRLRGPGGRLC